MIPRGSWLKKERGGWKISSNGKISEGRAPSRPESRPARGGGGFMLREKFTTAKVHFFPSFSFRGSFCAVFRGMLPLFSIFLSYSFPSFHLFSYFWSRFFIFFFLFHFFSSILDFSFFDICFCINCVFFLYFPIYNFNLYICIYIFFILFFFKFYNIFLWYFLKFVFFCCRNLQH